MNRNIEMFKKIYDKIFDGIGYGIGLYLGVSGLWIPYVMAILVFDIRMPRLSNTSEEETQTV